MAYIKEIKISYSRKRVDDDLLNKPVENPDQVYELFKDMQDEAKEKVVCLHLSPQLEVLSYELAAIGTAHSVLIDSVSIYRGALITAASSIIVVHNHPFGKCKPSLEDKEAAREMTNSGLTIKIPMNDFIIIGEDGYYSFAREGKI